MTGQPHAKRSESFTAVLTNSDMQINLTEGPVLSRTSSLYSSHESLHQLDAVVQKSGSFSNLLSTIKHSLSKNSLHSSTSLNKMDDKSPNIPKRSYTEKREHSRTLSASRLHSFTHTKGDTEDKSAFLKNQKQTIASSVSQESDLKMSKSDSSGIQVIKKSPSAYNPEITPWVEFENETVAAPEARQSKSASSTKEGKSTRTSPRNSLNRSKTKSSERKVTSPPESTSLLPLITEGELEGLKHLYQVTAVSADALYKEEPASNKKHISFYTVSRAHTMSMDQEPLPVSSSTKKISALPKYLSVEQYNNRRSSYHARVGETVSVTVYFNNFTTCVKHDLEVAVNTTVNEVRMEVLAKHNEASVLETFSVTKLEEEGLEVKLDPNLPLDYFIEVNAGSQGASQENLKSTGTQGEQLIFILRRKTPPRFNICFDIYLIEKSKKQRFVLADGTTRVKEVLDVLFSIEGLEENERIKYGLYREPCEINPKRKAKFFDLDERPFDITDPTTKYSLRDVSSKRVNKLTTILGVSGETFDAVISKEQLAMDDIKRKNEASRSLKLSHWLGIEPDDEDRKNKKSAKSKGTGDVLSLSSSTLDTLKSSPKSPEMKKKSPLGVTTLDMSQDHLQLLGSPSSPSPNEDASSVKLEMRPAHSTSTYLDPHIRPKLTKSGTVNEQLSREASQVSSIKTSHSSDSIVTMTVDHRVSFKEPDHPPSPDRKTAKLLDFFGVKAGEKETSMISNLARDKNKTQARIKRNLAKKDNCFITRMYFGNLTYCSLLLPMNATAEDTIKVVFKKFNIKDTPELYAIHVFQPQTKDEKELKLTDAIFQAMIKWEQDEIFVFKRRSAKRRLRASYANVNASQTSLLTSGENNDAGAPSKRVAKLSHFFGVDHAATATHTTKSRKDMQELQKLLSSMNKKLSTVDVSQYSTDPANTESPDNSLRLGENSFLNLPGTAKKEGWLLNKDKNPAKNCWVTVNNFTMTIKYTESKQEELMLLSEDVTLCLNQCHIDGTPTLSGKHHVFKMTDKNGVLYHFGAFHAAEAILWIHTIRNNIQIEDISESSPIEISVKVDDLNDAKLDNENGGMEKSLAEDATSLRDFEFHKVLGRGKFAQVILCSHKSTGKVFAVKVIDKVTAKEETGGRASQASVQMNQESKILRSVVHPFIVGLHFAFQSKERLYLVMEYVNGGELFFHISNFGRFSEERVRFYSAEILLALEYLHSKGVIYRDLKLENILLDKQGHIKVTDFGLSKIQGDEENAGQDVAHVVGTLEYLAPEVLSGYPATTAADWWAFGVVMYEMVCGFHPFYSEDRDKIKQFIMRAPIEFPDFVSDNAALVVANLLVRHPDKRLGSKHGARDLKKQAFFASVDFEKLYKKEITPPFEPELIDDFDVRFFDEQFTDEPIQLSPIHSIEDIPSQTPLITQVPPSFDSQL